ncbi:MAG: hypothetical protein PHC29_01670 [Candidatus Omnitrophica bacterium]|nr:hypothetical protein [Candidatus Omnitrophota bacterium]
MPPPNITAAILEAKANKTKANPSSIATIPKTMVVSGPAVLYQSTSTVAAGAVAEDIAPNNNANTQ